MQKIQIVKNNKTIWTEKSIYSNVSCLRCGKIFDKHHCSFRKKDMQRKRYKDAKSFNKNFDQYMFYFGIYKNRYING